MMKLMVLADDGFFIVQLYYRTGTDTRCHNPVSESSPIESPACASFHTLIAFLPESGSDHVTTCFIGKFCAT